MNPFRKLVSNTFIIGIGTIGSKLLVFLLMPLYTAWLTTAEYGTAELITTTANLLIPVACLGLANGVFRFAAEKGSDRTAVFSTSIALLGLGTLGFLALSPLLLFVDLVSEYFILIVLYVLFANVQSVCAHYVRATDNTKLFAIQGILNTLLTVLFNVLLLAILNLGVIGYVLSVILGNLFTVAFLVWQAKLWRVVRPSSVKGSILKDLLIFSLPLVPTTVCWLITDLSDRYMVTYFHGADVNGIYSAAYKIPTLMNLVAGIFMQAWQFSAVAESSDKETACIFYSKVLKGFLSVVFIGSAGLVLLTPVLTSLLLNRNYHGAMEYMPTLLCAVALEALVSFLATVYMVRKMSMHSFLTAIVGAILNVLLNFLLIPTMGPLGAAVATMASYGAVLVLRLFDVHRIMPFCMHLPRMVLNITLLLGAAAVMTFAGEWRMLWALPIVIAIIAVNTLALITTAKAVFSDRK